MLQTLEGFLSAPFGHSEPKSSEFETKYKRLVSNKKIYMEACTQVDDTYLVHIKVGSDSNAGVVYDVILHFFTDSDKVKKDISFRNYWVKFFSNSPSFMYQYAVLFKQNGMLIDVLGDKLSTIYADKLPEKSNPNMKISYDKSLYAACRWMEDRKVSAFSKVGFLARRKKRPEKFFADVQSFEDVQLSGRLSHIGNQVEKEAAKDKDIVDVPKKKRSPKGKVAKYTFKTQHTKITKATKPQVKSSTKPGVSYTKRTKRK